VRSRTRRLISRLHFLRLRRTIERLPADVKVLVIVGMKRSGHHAVVQWVVNGLSGSHTPLTDDNSSTLSHVHISTDESIVWINNIPKQRAAPDFSRMYDKRGIIRSCKVLLISYEDLPASEAITTWALHRSPDQCIYVNRNLANLVSSRVHRLVLRARAGINSPGPCDQRFFDVVAMNNDLSTNRWITVDFDAWAIGNSSYRTQLMAQLGLIADISAPVTSFGGGSSFSGHSTTPSGSDLTTRWRTHDWDTELVARMMASAASSTLTDEQRQWFDNFLAAQPSRTNRA
jgi:hypothetical protein